MISISWLLMKSIRPIRALLRKIRALLCHTRTKTTRVVWAEAILGKYETSEGGVGSGGRRDELTARRDVLFQVFRQLEPDRRRLHDADDGTRRAARLRGPRLLVDARRHGLDVPRDSDGLHEPNDVPRRIEFPPVETVSRRALVAVVVVVPPLPDGEERGERVVARLIDRI